MTAPFPPEAPHLEPPPLRPALRRSRTDKVAGGVAGGLAEYSGVDALLWRVGFVALTLAGGTGIAVYLLLWLLMPAGPAFDGPGASRAPRIAGPRSPVPGLTLAGLLIVVGSLVLLSRFTDWDVGPRIVLGTGLLVVGLGLVAAAFSGGRTAKGGLITLGIVLSLALMVVAAEPWRGVDDGMGDRIYLPADADAVQPVYDQGIGDATLDLSRIDLSGLDGPIVTRVDGGVGNVEVVVPRSADVRIEVDGGIGNVDVLGLGSDGGYSPGTGSASWTGDGNPEIELTIDAGVGDVEVRRA
jgi:phage shock protein PspC (stress-responsive transcriptional regulator)